MFNFFREKTEYTRLVINYRVITHDFKTPEDEIVLKALRHLNAFRAMMSEDQELQLIEKITKGDIDL